METNDIRTWNLLKHSVAHELLETLRIEAWSVDGHSVLQNKSNNWCYADMLHLLRI